MFHQKFNARIAMGLVLVGLVAGTVACTPDTPEAKISPHFDTRNLQPLVPFSSYEAISRRMIGAIYTVEEVTSATTTFIYDNAATKPCRFEVPTTSIELKEEGTDHSYLRLHYKEGVDQSKLVSCDDLTANVSRIEIKAEPEVVAQFAR